MKLLNNFQKKEDEKIEVPIKWKNIGINESQEIVEAINEAYQNRELLDATIYYQNEIKEIIDNNSFEFKADLFLCYSKNDILVIDFGEGKISINKNIIKKYL